MADSYFDHAAVDNEDALQVPWEQAATSLRRVESAKLTSFLRANPVTRPPRKQAEPIAMMKH